MRWVRYATGGAVAHGFVADGLIHQVDGDLFGAHRPTGHTVKPDEVTLLPPVVPGTFFCVGLNYADHIEHARATGYASKAPDRPEVGYRANSALVGHGATIVKPADYTGERFEAEGELVAVIGRPLRRCSRDEAQAGVLGWTIGNDVSARTWQHTDRTMWRSKNADTFKPMGPWIDTAADPLSSTTTTTVAVNGEVRSSFGTGAMVFDPYDYIVEISRYITLSPRDVLWMGADGGVGIAPGDVVEISISGLGTLSNPVALEEEPT